MTKKLLCLCAVGALLFAVSMANVASAQEVMSEPGAPVACPCGVAPCNWAYSPGCCPPVTYRVGLFGYVRPVVYAPAYRPVYVAPRFAYRYAGPPYVVPFRPVVAPYCW